MPSRIMANWAARQFDPGGGGFGEVVPPGFQSLAPQTETVAAPVQDLDPVGGAIGEHEQVARERIGGELGADQVGQPVESEPQIDGGREPQLGGGRDGQHGRSSNPAGSRRSAPGGCRRGTARRCRTGGPVRSGSRGREAVRRGWARPSVGSRRRGRLGEASPPQVEVGLGHAFGGAERDHGVVAGGEAFEAFDPPPGGDRVGTGAGGRVGHDGILRERKRMPSTINHTSIT